METLNILSSLRLATELFAPWLLIASVASLASEVRKLRKGR